MSDYEADVRYYAALYEEQGYDVEQSVELAKELMHSAGIDE